ncbi:MAG: pilus assembly protein PilP, partial [Candidatus Acidiferrales bacterium]
PDASAGGDKIEAVGKRDPFVPLVTDKKDTGAEHLPPGKAGIVIASVRVDGTVKSGNGMIAVVSNPDQRVYFIREGDHLYDGDVEKISLDGVTFKEDSKDAFGKPVERIVTKRIYASAGEQQ